jgi:Ser/Thr protein kinase RdoA (MazF antagonist)
MGLAPGANLAYQMACFERAQASDHTPGLLGLLLPSAALPRGALIVEEIIGRPVALPQDLTAIVTTLARLHRLPLPAPATRAPLTSAADPMTDLLGEIEAQALWLDAAVIDVRARRAIDAEIERYRSLCAQAPRPPLSLIAFDAHPGNFLVRAEGDAVLVDLEKCRYSHASLDLAHATLYTSTTWSEAGSAALGVDEVAGAYAAWSREKGPSAAASNQWHLPLRRAMWLWSITWCAKWRVASTAVRAVTAAGEDWSARLSEPALIAHVRGRVDHYLSATVVGQVLDGIDALERALSKPGERDPGMIGPHRP